MRLINVHDYNIHEFTRDYIPPYAILSHCWGRDEVSLSDMQCGRARGMLGFWKIEQTCKKAIEDQLDWAWVDTCCIDKANFAELSEAINSMYQWYARSKICYAYLADYSTDFHSGGNLETSRWFTRGWTLQELISPPKLELCDRDWITIGHRDGLAGAIEKATGIPRAVLVGEEPPFVYTVAARMSWASKRSCSLVEDTAYCLMGLFDVHLPLIYGEEKKAFIRLQEAILAESVDQSLLAWTVDRHSPQAWTRTGVLAESPANFALSGELLTSQNDNWEPWSMTPLGLKISGLPRPYDLPSRRDSLLSLPQLFSGFQIVDITLDCGRESTNSRPRRWRAHNRPRLSEFVKIKIIRTLGSRRNYHRFVTPYLEYGQRQEAAENELQLLYIAKKFEVQKAPFESGGIHVFHLPMGSLGSPDMRPRDLKSRPTTAFNAVSFMWPSCLSQGGCYQVLDDESIDPLDPFHIVFEDQTPESTGKFSLYFGLGLNIAYVGLFNEVHETDSPNVIQTLRGRFGAYCSDDRKIRHTRNLPIVWDSLHLGKTVVQAQLVAEDAQTLEEEMVGTRVHYFVMMRFDSDQSSEWVKTENKDGVDSGVGSSPTSSSVVS